MQQWETSKQLLVSLIRYGLIFISGVLVTKGVITQEMADAWLSETSLLLAGGAIALVTILWRWLNIRFRVAELFKALQTDPPLIQAPGTTEAALEEVRREVKAEQTAVSSI